MVADKRHKSAALQKLCGERITAPFDELQLLVFRIAHGEDHSPAFGKLREKRLRNCGSGGGNKNGLEGSEFRQSQRTIATMYVRIRIAKPS